ncbi:MAG: hypothetical protein JW984_10960 [Deltaproteobacteria bacterium]|uniref:Alginate export domain-containing protein n=1 Tax=Candidatus Zymogenus saltonus TaxID=2844893 RepID=A0A9D8KGF4_9DELT|nr:hypothetical protein [Candidatus Zymogenus saltonus]
MRRFLILLLAVMFIATAFTALAAETTFSGIYYIRAWSEYNFDKKLEDSTALPSHENPQYDGWVDQRFRLTITHKRSEYLKAVIRIDLVEDTWGQQRNLRINNSTVGASSPWAYLEFTFPKLGTFTAGKFPQTYGYGLAFSDNGAGTTTLNGLTGVRWANAWGPVAASLLYAKIADRVTRGSNNSWYNWDADLYAMNLKVAPAKNHLIELFGGYMQDNDANGAGNLGGVLRNSYAWSTLRWLGVGGDYCADIGFAGLAYTGKIGDMFDIKFENSYVLGHATRHYGPGLFVPVAGANMAPPSIHVNGWNIYTDLSYYNDLLRVGMVFLMSSGQHHLWVDPVNGPNYSSYDNINMNYISQAQFEFNKILVAKGGGINSIYRNSLFGQWSTENLTAAKLYFEICPVEKLTLNASVTWAKWTEDVGQNFAGTRAALVSSKGAGYPHPAVRYGNYMYQSWDASDDLGWEVDFGFSYEIMEGLTYKFCAGVLFTGDSWDYEKADGTRGGWGEIWSITNVLLYEF